MEPCDKRIKDAPPNPPPTDMHTLLYNFGFGFDPKTNDYKVVRILKLRSILNAKLWCTALVLILGE
jgi:hypothetical protein